MEPDGSSGKTVGGESIPNIDSVKKTIAAYYGDTGTGASDKASSPYISEMKKIVRKATAELRPAYDRAIRRGEKPAIVLDADDTTAAPSSASPDATPTRKQPPLATSPRSPTLVVSSATSRAATRIGRSSFRTRPTTFPDGGFDLGRTPGFMLNA